LIPKYYPPDFDPTLIPRARRPKNEQYKVRMMVPMSIRCLTCGEFIYKGKKFNARKETVQCEEYLGIKIFRFYIKCTRCSSEITIKTDPKNSDYVCEMGATRNFEGWKEGEKKMEEYRKKREEEEEGNAMKVLENKTIDNKMEMDILDGLDEIRSLNARVSKLDPLDVLDQLQQQDRDVFTEDLEEERTIRELLRNQAEPFVQRLPDPGENPLFKPLSIKVKEEANGMPFKAPSGRLPTRKCTPSGFVSILAGVGADNGRPVISLKFQPKYRNTTLCKNNNNNNSPEIIGSLSGLCNY